MEKISEFFEYFGEPNLTTAVSNDTLEKYSQVFMGRDDTEDIIVKLWEKYGFASFGNGLFWLVNPDEYNDVARQFKEVSHKAIVFGRTATGSLFLWEWIDVVGRPVIVYLNVHTRERIIKSDEFAFFLDDDVSTNYMWKKQFYGEVELAVVDKFGPIAHDEAVVYVPALALGGDEKLGNMEALKLIPHLMILSQLD
ncbi:GAD-like domain-containing protein [Flavivirga jejuensis]|uniref:GAD-like domain-containing protein n=1 Tax=Flavivirga jejuensis TaxID=870487 RepID=A0ABT8WPL1_9FLAO|nr:GAD-like domain-containing protein [Flavivirga jejuensis]MDO5974846.1 GAD-like domain-containing protein [Flavivirga jejuensis]